MKQLPRHHRQLLSQMLAVREFQMALQQMRQMSYLNFLGRYLPPLRMYRQFRW
jgi:hypothetical protein